MKRTKRGSVMLEYLIVQVFIASLLMTWMVKNVYSHSSGFGPMGKKLCYYYERIAGGLSLPSP